MADVSSVSPSSEQTLDQQRLIWYVSHREVWCIADVSSVKAGFHFGDIGHTTKRLLSGHAQLES